MNEFAIAGIQTTASNGDSRQAIKQQIERLCARFAWIDMVVLGELASFGADPALAETLPGETEDFYADIARELGIWLVPGSHFERLGDQLYNTTSVIDPSGHVVDRYRKMFPFYPYEKGVSAGSNYVVFDVPGRGRIGLCICYDQWFPEVIRTLAWMGAEVILCPTMTNTSDRDLELCLARANAISNQCYYFNINVTGPLGNGRSIVIDPEGKVMQMVGELPEPLPQIVDFDHVRRVRERGVMGLGQTLKSFRDSEMAFPAHEGEARREGSLARLGELAVPRNLAGGG